MPRPLTPSDTVLSMAACDQNTDRFIRKRVRAKGTRPTADISLADRDQTRADAFILQPRFLWARYSLPDLRNSAASTLRTSDWEIPNCLAMREGVIPALGARRPTTAGIFLRIRAASSSQPGRSAWRAASPASPDERLRAAAAGRHASLRLQDRLRRRPSMSEAGEPSSVASVRSQ